MLSPKAQAVADNLKSFSKDDVTSLSEMIKHEVEHVSDALTKRAKVAEERLKQFTHSAQDAGRRAVKTVDDHPLSSSAVALGAGFLLGFLLTHRKHDDAY